MIKIDFGEYYEEMATVADDEKLSLKIQVTPDRRRKGNPYFKVFNSVKIISGETKAARLHFKNSGIEYHTDSFKIWIPDKKEIKNIIDFLNIEHIDFPEYNNWQIACYLWNLEYGFLTRNDRIKYLDGNYDNQYNYHPSYIPSTCEIPETWNF